VLKKNVVSADNENSVPTTKITLISSTTFCEIVKKPYITSVPDPHVFGPPGSGSCFESGLSEFKKKLDHYSFVIYLPFFSLKNALKVPSKINMQENLWFRNLFLLPS
jgi:hypothetical protein